MNFVPAAVAVTLKLPYSVSELVLRGKELVPVAVFAVSNFGPGKLQSELCSRHFCGKTNELG